MQPAMGESSHRLCSAPPAGYPMRTWRPSSNITVYTSPQVRAGLCPHTPLPVAPVQCSGACAHASLYSTPTPPQFPCVAFRGRIFHSLRLKVNRLYLRKQLRTHSFTGILPYQLLNFHKVILKFSDPWPTPPVFWNYRCVPSPSDLMWDQTQGLCAF